jgi:hypothetical protein
MFCPNTGIIGLNAHTFDAIDRGGIWETVTVYPCMIYHRRQEEHKELM